MVRQKFLKNRKIQLIIVLLALFLSPFILKSYALDNTLDNIPAAKDAETFSVDWINKELNSLRSHKGETKTISTKTKSKDPKATVDSPIAYQNVAGGPEMDVDISDLAPDSTDLTEQEPGFENVEAGITDIRATVGKSQIIQFAQPIKRLSITDPSLADLILLSPTQMIMNGKAAGVTSLIIWDESDQPAFFDLYVQNDTTDLLDAIKKVAPDEPVQIKITDDGNVILSGTVSSTLVRDSIKKICEAYGYQLVDVAESPVPQVVLEMRIAEISRSVSKNFSLFYKVGAWADVSIAPTYTTSPRDPNGGQGGSWDGNSLNGFTAAIFKPNARFSAILGMARQRGLLNVLAEPKLVTTNGREATFDAGQSIPVPTGVDQNGNLAYEYKDIGVKVTFTPWISEKSERIELHIEPEVSEIDPSVTIVQPSGVTIFGFRKRKAKTTVELENGETIMIAGLVRRTDTNTYTDVPFFGNIPIIGKLLNTSSFEKGESELVIIITPRLVKPGVYGDVLGTSE